MISKVLVFLLLVSSSYGACPAGSTYESMFNKCYKYVTREANFQKAQENCVAMGGSVVSVTNAFENAYIAGIVETISPTQSYWIGLTLLNSTQWSWINGDNSTYFDWAGGQQRMDPNVYQCAAVRGKDNEWTKEKCNEIKSYMCQIITNATAPIPGSCPGGSCPDPSYTLNPDSCKCYKFYPGSVTSYNDSSKVCASENGIMAVIENEPENRFIASYVTSISPPTTRNPYIGLWCTGTTVSSCQWADGSPVTYSNFYPGYPHGNEPAYLDEATQQWFGFPDWDYGSYVCQQKGIPASNTPQLSRGKPFLPEKSKKTLL